MIRMAGDSKLESISDPFKVTIITIIITIGMSFFPMA